jgi:hypothetical protein
MSFSDFVNFVKDHIISTRDVTNEFVNVEKGEKIIEIEIDDELARILGRTKKRFCVIIRIGEESCNPLVEAVRRIIMR